MKPVYGDPMYSICEIVGPGETEIHIDILDIERFRKKMSDFILKGNKITLTKICKNNKEIKIHIVNSKERK